MNQHRDLFLLALLIVWSTAAGWIGADHYNLAASSQNALRQQIRERVYATTNRRHIEAFVDARRIEIAQAEIDYNAGIAAARQINETEITASSITIGAKSVGKAGSAGLDVLADGKPETVYTWVPDPTDSNQLTLELVYTFDAVEIINRIRIQLDEYSGLDLVEVTSSPDGSLRENILDDLRTDQTRLDGASSKFSGDVILDFDPRHMKNLRLRFSDRTGERRIALRNIRFYRKQYENQGLIQSTKLEAPRGACWFSTVEHTAQDLTKITHQISSDGVHFTVIQPETQIMLDAPFWYRAVLQRDDKGFERDDKELRLTGEDPKLTSNFSLTSSNTTDLGGGVMQRRIDVNGVSGAIQLREAPLPGTLSIIIGSAIAGDSIYTFDAETSTIRFLSPQSVASIRYQASVLSAASLQARKRYYSPYLHEVRFELNVHYEE